MINRWFRFIDELTRRPGADRQQYLDRQFPGLQKRLGFPVLGEDRAVFVFRGSARRVAVTGDMTGWRRRLPLSRIPGTDLFMRDMALEPAARLEYKIVADGEWRMDPLNARVSPGGCGENSELRMPRYRSAPEADPDAPMPPGRRESFRVRSVRLAGSRRVTVYLPAAYSARRRWPVVFFHDGAEYLAQGLADRILAYMERANELAAVGVFVHHGDRTRDFTLNPAYADFFADELPADIAARYSLSREPGRRVMVGDSLGALAAGFIAYRHPGVFGGCVLQSGAFNLAYPPARRSRFQKHEREPFGLAVAEAPLPTRFCLVWGSYERAVCGLDLAAGNERFAADLRRNPTVRGVAERVLPQGHNWGLWRDTLRDGLRWSFGGRGAGRRAGGDPAAG